jgi:hypothetical protein
MTQKAMRAVTIIMRWMAGVAPLCGDGNADDALFLV